MSKIELSDITSIVNSAYNEDIYNEYISSDDDSFNSPLINDIKNVYNKIVSEFDITNDQESVLKKIFDSMEYTQRMIDPDRIRDFVYCMTEDDDLVLSRENDTELLNLIIHPEDDFSLSIIGKSLPNNMFRYINETADYESVVYTFFK